MNAKQICDQIKKVAETTSRAALPSISAIILLCSLAKRPGLSTIMSVINIVQAIKHKGIPTENNPDGSPNLVVQVIYQVVDEIYRAIREDARTDVAIAPSAMTIIGNGENAGGPVVITATNVAPVSGMGQTQ